MPHSKKEPRISQIIIGSFSKHNISMFWRYYYFNVVIFFKHAPSIRKRPTIKKGISFIGNRGQQLKWYLWSLKICKL